jgi:peptidoglycan/LPS O-acetylase OafA/YrhL
MNINSTRQKVGLVIAGLLSAISVPSVLVPTPDGEEGPPMGILILSTVLGIIGLIAVVSAWRGNRVALRVAAGALIVSALAAVPAFFVDVPVGIKLTAGVATLLTIAAVVLMFSPARQTAPLQTEEVR